jgi:hypothetical protein
MEVSQTTPDTFLTQAGRETKETIAAYSSLLGLNRVLGCSDLHYEAYVPFASENSLYRLYVESVFPSVVQTDEPDVWQVFVCNSATLRYDLYAGPVVQNDIYNICPFNDSYYYFPMNGSQIKLTIPYIEGWEDFKLDLAEYRSTRNVEYYNAPRYFYSDISQVPDEADCYLVCADYDANALSGKLATRFPEQTWDFYPYLTNYTSTTAVQTYVETYMQSCN